MQRNAELFQMQKDQFEFQKKANEQTQTLNDIKIKQAEQQQVAKEKVGRQALC